MSATPYATATARAASLYVPGHPTEAWREACRAAERAWAEMRGRKPERGVQGRPQARETVSATRTPTKEKQP